MFLLTSFITLFGFSQQHFADDSLEYSLDLPNDFTFEKRKNEAVSLVAYSNDSSLIFKAGRIELLPIYKTSMDYLNHFDEVLFDLGYSENLVDPEARSSDSLQAAKSNADDIAYGIFEFTKENEYYMESVCLYRKGKFVYLLTAVFPSDEFNQRILEFQSMIGSFKLKE